MGPPPLLELGLDCQNLSGLYSAPLLQDRLGKPRSKEKSSTHVLQLVGMSRWDFSLNENQNCPMNWGDSCLAIPGPSAYARFSG